MAVVRGGVEPGLSLVLKTADRHLVTNEFFNLPVNWQICLVQFVVDGHAIDWEVRHAVKAALEVIRTGTP